MMMTLMTLMTSLMMTLMTSSLVEPYQKRPNWSASDGGVVFLCPPIGKLYLGARAIVAIRFEHATGGAAHRDLTHLLKGGKGDGRG